MAYQIHKYNEAELPYLKREKLVEIRRDLGRDWTIATSALKSAEATHNEAEIVRWKDEIAKLEPQMHALSKWIGDIDRAEAAKKI